MSIVTADLDNTEHQQAILDLLDMYARDPMGGGSPLPAATRNTLIAGLRQQPQAVILLACADDRPIGLLIGFQGFSTFQAKPLLNIHDIAVVPAARGTGIGRKLLQEAERISRQLGYGQISLEVRIDNTVAQNLYKSEGYKDCDPPMWFWKKQL